MASSIVGDEMFPDADKIERERRQSHIWANLIIVSGALLIVGALIVSCSGSSVKEDVCHGTNAQIGALLVADSFVKDTLKTPSTAKFAHYSDDGVSVRETGTCGFTVVSHVDAENSFGAHIRSRYIVDLEVDPMSERATRKSILVE